MEIQQPIWGVVSLLLGIVVSLALLWWGKRRRASILADWLGREARTDLAPRKRMFRSVLLVVAIAFVGLGIVRPRLRGEQLALVEPGDVVLLVDCSRSMLAADVVPSRFELARQVARRLVLEAPARRFALVAFAGESFVECPLTHDREMLCLFLDRLNLEAISLPGTNLNLALDEAARAAKAAQGGSVAMVLLTDGEDTAEAGTAREIPGGTALLVVGVGNPDQASPIPTGNGVLKDPATGKPVASRPDFAALRRLAETADGRFAVAGEDTGAIANEWLRDRFRRQPTAAELDQTGRELYPLLVAVALLCLLVRWAMGERQVPAMVTVLALVLSGVQAQASTEEDYASAMSLLQHEKYAEAVVAWQGLAHAQDLSLRIELAVRLNLGVAHHQLGRQLASVPGAGNRALAAYAQAEVCYSRCLWDETQAARAKRNLAHLVADRQKLAPPPSSPADDKGETDPASEPPPEETQSTRPGEGGGTQSEGGADGAPTVKAGAEAELTPDEAAQAVQSMREQEGDFNEALRKRQERSWRTAPPKRPW